MNARFAAAVALGLSLAPAARPEDDTEKDQKSLQSAWRLVALERDGKTATRDELKEVKDPKLTVKGDELSHTIPGSPFKGTFKLDATKKPRAIDLTGTLGPDKGKTYPGIYSLDGDTLRVCLGPAGGARPTQFKADKGALNLRLTRSKPTWEAKTHTNAKGQAMPYRLLLPEDYDPKKAYPLVVFLDGIGARGTDNEKQLANAALLVRNKNRQEYPCFVVAPQCPGGKDFPFWNQGVHSGLVMGVIEEVERGHRVDPKRVYATGLSDGGFGVWFLLEAYPDKFAAGVPISGQCLGPAAAPKIAHIPVWSFHGEKDKPGPVRDMIAALEKAGGKPKYTEYANEGHGVWGRAYGDPELFAWLFAQKRK